ncbi:hypothetical protein KKF34_15415 [Myxococcota bacterium]|nr:hypothetical protein [Myxococcota bacterium]MBU1382253.1 hypothetical protein [Myxococcota bacterium]MBU1498266.1 hypothetical protein [Myxococcota bacterium]
MPRIIVLTIIVVLSQSCSLIVTRSEADEMKLRIQKISDIVKKRRQEEKSIGEAIEKARRQLNELRELREKYRSEQEKFITKVRLSLDTLNKTLSGIEKKVETMDSSTVKTLRTEIADVSRVLEQRAAELLQYEDALKSITTATVKMSAEHISKIVQALAVAKEWTIMHGQIAILTVKYGTTADFAKALIFSIEELYKANEHAKVILYSALYLRQFPAEASRGRVMFLQGNSYYKFMNCSNAITVLSDYLRQFPADNDAKEAKTLLTTIKSNKHSKQFCAR